MVRPSLTRQSLTTNERKTETETGQRDSAGRKDGNWKGNENADLAGGRVHICFRPFLQGNLSETLELPSCEMKTTLLTQHPLFPDPRSLGKQPEINCQLKATKTEPKKRKIVQRQRWELSFWEWGKVRSAGR